MFYHLRVLLFCAFAVCTNAFAATDAEIRLLLDHMKAEALVKSSIFEVNAYQLSKRQAASEEARIASRREFAVLVEKHLSWPRVEPLLVKSYSAALSSSDAAILTAFFQSEASRPYLEGYLYAAAPMAIALDQFIDNMVDKLVDEPDLPLERIEKLQPQEVVAARLEQTLRAPKDKAEFATQRKAWLASVDGLLRPKTKDEKALQRYAERTDEVGRVFSEEQITWRMARVLSQRLPVAQIEQILAELSDNALLAALHNLKGAGKSAEAPITQQFLGDPEVSEWINKMLATRK